MSRKPAKFYFSFHSPYSWMAAKLLEQRVPDAPELLEYIPYCFPDEQMLADMDARGVEVHYTNMSKAKHLYILQDTKRLAGRFGFDMTWPVDVNPWWVLPHHAWLSAKRTGDQHKLFWTLLDARWERGENITDRATVIRLLDQAGLDGKHLASAPEDQELRREGVDGLESAYMDDAFGVPYFKIGPHRFWGLDRLDDFVAALELKVAQLKAKETGR
ncbi:DsbA family protein [Kitasatospora sp. P5_F3]